MKTIRDRMGYIATTFFLVAAQLAAAQQGPAAAGAAARERPNIILILADDLGYADIGVHGCSDISTPHIDAIARSGVLCTQGYSSHSYCSPMRAGLMTGRYQHRFGYENNMPYDAHNRFMGLPTDQRTIAARLREVGYTTGALGKWHLGAAHPFHPNHRGFDFFYGFLGGGHDYFTVDLQRPLSEGYFDALQRNGQPEGLDEYLTTKLSQEAVGFMDANRERPFFLYLAYNAPHTPLQAPQSYLDEFASIADPRRRAYAAMVHAMDDGIGMVLETLDRLGLRDNTLVFFLSDNGGPEDANASCNDPLRGQKGQVYEGGIRVPFLASWPARLPAGVVYDHPVISLDIACTALAVGAAKAEPDPSRLDGVNLVPYFCGEADEPPHEALFWRQSAGRVWAVRAGEYKLLQDGDAAAAELYQLSQDVGEAADLAEDQTQRIESLRRSYEQWDAHNQLPFFPSFREYWPHMDRVYREISGGEGEK
jgi:arylsulfatase A-like enzyme